MILFLSTLLACWTRNPGPVPVEVAREDVQLIAVQAPGPAAWLEVSVRAGAAHDPIGKEGLAWLAAKMLREGGTESRAPEEVEAALESMGASLSVMVDYELCSFRLKALEEDLPAAAALAGELFSSPRWDMEVFDRLKFQASEALGRGILASDERLGATVFNIWMFQGHPYGHPLQGRAGVVPTLTLQDVRNFYADRYLRPVSVLGVAGSMSDSSGVLDPAHPGTVAAEGLQRRLTDSFGARIYKAPTPKKVPTPKGRELLVVEKETAATGIHFGFPTELHRGHPDWPAMLVATTALGAHRQSFGRLYKALRGERGLNYGDYAYIESYRQAGGSRSQEIGSGRLQNPFYVWLRPVSAANGPFALRAAVSMVEEFAANGLEEEEFRTVQTYLSRQVALWAKNPGRRLGWKTEAALMGWPDPIAELPALIQALTLEETNAAIARHVRPDGFKALVVTRDGEKFSASVEGDSSPIVYDAEPPEAGSDQDTQDGEYARYSLGLQTTSRRAAEGILQ
jgi:zinc protease